jgi:hypothetical protein
VDGSHFRAYQGDGSIVVESRRIQKNPEESRRIQKNQIFLGNKKQKDPGYSSRNLLPQNFTRLSWGW